MYSKHRHIPRIYILEITDKFELTPEQLNHLINVLRLKIGSNFIAFNPNDGEWKCELISSNKKQAIAKRVTCLRTYTCTPKLCIAFGIVKPENVKLIIEKCTELGTTDFFPLITEYTQHKHINIEKLRAVAINASEQSERIDIPNINEPTELSEFIKNMPTEITWMSAIERSGISSSKCTINNVGFIIGPEGGFSDTERLLLSSKTIPVGLGSNILKAETACIACACLAMH